MSCSEIPDISLAPKEFNASTFFALFFATRSNKKNRVLAGQHLRFKRRRNVVSKSQVVVTCQRNDSGLLIILPTSGRPVSGRRLQTAI